MSAAWHPRALPRGDGEIRLEQRGGRAELVLDNPGARNAVSPGMMVDLEDAVRALEQAEGVSVLVRGAGAAAFCAGGDLNAVRASLLEPGAGAGMTRFMGQLLDRLADLPRVVLAAVEGAALGGGAELLTAADLVVAAEGARIGFVQAALGVSPGWGGGRRLLRRIGARRALPLLAMAPVLRGAEALAVGLVDRVVPDGGAVEAGRAWLDALDALPPEAVRAAIQIGRGATADEEIRLFEALWGGPAHREALAAGPRRGRR